MIAGWLTNGFRSAQKQNVYNLCSSFTQTRNYAARKGTREKAREKARKRKVKVVVEKVGFLPFKKGAKDKKKTVSPLTLIDDSWKQTAIDDVWITKYHRSPVYSLSEAIECHREMHHPTIMNQPDAPLTAFIECNMRKEKKNRFVEKHTRIIEVPHMFSYGKVERSILALCKNTQEQQKALRTGADMVGGVELIKEIQNGSLKFKEYNHIVAHADILSELLLIRGLLRKQFPNVNAGTLGTDMVKIVSKFKYGIQYTIQPHEEYKEYGSTNVVFGLLDMDSKKLEENLQSLLNNIESFNPLPEGIFIQRVQIKSEPSNEIFKIDFKKYLSVKNEKKSKNTESEKEEGGGAVEDNIGIIPNL